MDNIMNIQGIKFYEEGSTAYSDLLLICWSLWSSARLLKKKRDLLCKNGVDFSEEQSLYNSTMELARKMSNLADSYPGRREKHGSLYILCHEIPPGGEGNRKGKHSG